jgi:hypothetical protein
MLDVFPLQKRQHEFVPPITYGELENGPKARSPEEARRMADSGKDTED